MEVIAILEYGIEFLGEQAADDGFAGARDSHDDDGAQFGGHVAGGLKTAWLPHGNNEKIDLSRKSWARSPFSMRPILHRLIFWLHLIAGLLAGRLWWPGCAS